VTWGFRFLRWYRMNHASDLDATLLFHVCLLFCHSVGTVVGIGMIGYSWYWYSFYKWQGLITVMLPSNDVLYDYWVGLGFAITGQTITIGMIVWQQTRHTIFFIDWESSQGRMPGRDGSTAKCPVSTWRQLFIANEFAKLQTERLVSFEFSCIWVTAFMIGFELQYSACINPTGSDLYACNEKNISGILRFAVSTFFWVVVVLAQVVYVKIIMHRYVRHPSSQLVDLMSLTNISAFILTDKYAGYYIHGQSNLPHADTDLETVAGLLEREEQNITSSRGLLADDDTQTFVMHITQEVRDKFDDFLELQHNEDTERTARAGGTSGQLLDEFRDRGVRTVQKHSDPIYAQMRGTNSSLKGFIKKMQTAYRHQILEMDYSQKIFQLPPARDEFDYATFLKDEYGTWVQIFYEGIEHELLLFDIMLFGFWNLALEHTMSAMLLTYLFQKAIDTVRQELGGRNIAKTTLVGDRFFL